MSTSQGPHTDDDSYLGYSVAAGNFSGEPGPGDAAVGMPRGHGLFGQVVLFSWNVKNLQNITGEQIGAYFGYSLCVGDIDGDSRDDLVIGAPMYTDLSNNMGHYETGRIYVVYQGSGTRDGKNSKGRFGLALASLRDINRDGYGDFAVGAPYDGPKERGAVYIFHGSSLGVRPKASQIIYSEDIIGQPATFGFSLAGGHDLDRNEYPDVVVGAYESDMAVFLKARPVVKVTASITFVGEKSISLKEKNCTLKDSTKVPCHTLNICIQYDGLGVNPQLEFDLQFILDAKKVNSPRMYFISNEGRNVINQTLILEKGKQKCKSMFVYIKPNIRDKLTAIEAEMVYSLKERGGSNIRKRSLTPILNLNEELSRKDSITIQKNCGRDNICIPDLRLIATPSVDQYLLGSGERLNLDVMVQNEGEDAFEAVFDLKVPPGLNYVKIERLDEAEKEIAVQCSAPAFINNNTLHCDIGNPLPKEKLVRFNVVLQPYHQEGMKQRYEFSMAVNSTNPENRTSVSDNFQELAVPIWVETDLILLGFSQPADVHHNTSLYKAENITHESQVGPQVSHIYSIRNKGPSDIVETEAIFLWPAYTLAGDHLLYLLEQPKTSDNVKCEYVEDVNAENLKVSLSNRLKQ
ncbi:hypothetical protein AAG570_009936 [Ranatra chinensis]|uniref:Integrin alpha-2 domain-containing protein n=1 Tax=Ranatra chinensis TaxID=642074 RepID=A0ABD0Z3I2_9HEMI